MNRNVIAAFVVLIASILACAVPPGMTPTAIIVTQVVVVPNEQVQPSPTLPLPTVPPVTFTLVSTETPADTATATITATATLDGPIITFIKNANCRKGPGSNYDVVTSYLKGQTLQILGRNPDFSNTWWYVNMPTGGKCWVSFSTGQAYGDFDAIPIVNP